MDSSLYSQSKALHHHHSMRELREGRTPYPVHVQLILSDLCNQDCGFCAYRMSNGLSTELFGTAETHNPNRKIPTDKAKQIIRDLASVNVKAVQFTGGGEPTVHRDHLQLFALAQRNMQTALVTNGVRLQVAEPVLNMAWIRVSVDAGTPETYAKVRRVSESHWHKVWSNIEALHDYDGKLGVGFVVTPENHTEIARCAELARAHGADNIRIGAVFSEAGPGFYGKLIPAIKDRIAEALEYETDEFKVIDLFGRRIDDLGGPPEHEFCGYQAFTTYIGADLNVYRCCNTAYTTAGLIGSLKKHRFYELDPGIWSFNARNCRFCQFRGQNKAILDALDTPEHVDFV